MSIDLTNDDWWLEHGRAEVTAAVTAFAEALGGRPALEAVDAELADALADQCDLYRAALIAGQQDEITRHGDAVLRGFAVATQTMEAAAKAKEDAIPWDGICYVTGQWQDTIVAIPVTGTVTSRKVVESMPIGKDDRLVIMSPDEVALLMGSTCRSVADIKQRFPAAEIINGKRDGRQ